MDVVEPQNSASIPVSVPVLESEAMTEEIIDDSSGIVGNSPVDREALSSGMMNPGKQQEQENENEQEQEQEQENDQVQDRVSEALVDGEEQEQEMAVESQQIDGVETLNGGSDSDVGQGGVDECASGQEGDSAHADVDASGQVSGVVHSDLNEASEPTTAEIDGITSTTRQAPMSAQSQIHTQTQTQTQTRTSTGTHPSQSTRIPLRQTPAPHSPSPPARTPSERARDRILNRYAHQSLSSFAKVRDLLVEENQWLNAVLSAVEALKGGDMGVGGGGGEGAEEEERPNELVEVLGFSPDQKRIGASANYKQDIRPRPFAEIVRQRMEAELSNLQAQLEENVDIVVDYDGVTSEHEKDHAVKEGEDANQSRPENDTQEDLSVLYAVIAKLQKDKSDAQTQKDELKNQLREIMLETERLQHVQVERLQNAQRKDEQDAVHAEGAKMDKRNEVTLAGNAAEDDAVRSEKTESAPGSESLQGLDAAAREGATEQASDPITGSDIVAERDRGVAPEAGVESSGIPQETKPALYDGDREDSPLVSVDMEAQNTSAGSRGNPHGYQQIPADLPEYDEMEKMLRDLRGYVDVVIKFYGETGELPPPGIYQNPHYPGVNGPYIPEKIYQKRKGRPPRIAIGNKMLPQALQKLLANRRRQSPRSTQDHQAVSVRSKREREKESTKPIERNVEASVASPLPKPSRRVGRPLGSTSKRKRTEEEGTPKRQKKAGTPFETIVESTVASVSASASAPASAPPSPSPSLEEPAIPTATPKPPKSSTRSVRQRARAVDEGGHQIDTVVAHGIDMSQVSLYDEMDPTLSTQIPYSLQFQHRALAAATTAAAAETDASGHGHAHVHPHDQLEHAHNAAEQEAEAASRMVQDLMGQSFEGEGQQDHYEGQNVEAMIADGHLNLAQANQLDPRHWNLAAEAAASYSTGLEPAPADACQNCGRRETSAWRKTVVNRKEYKTCNACGLHYQKNGVMRPPSLWGDIHAQPKRRDRQSHRNGGPTAKHLPTTVMGMEEHSLSGDVDVAAGVTGAVFMENDDFPQPGPEVGPEPDHGDHDHQHEHAHTHEHEHAHHDHDQEPPMGDEHDVQDEYGFDHEMAEDPNHPLAHFEGIEAEQATYTVDQGDQHYYHQSY